MNCKDTAPSISVIVPVYNAEKYLDRCFSSILGQTFTDFELLLVDDGSTDSSGDICDRLAQSDSRVRVIHKPNGGVSSARNVGIDKSIGKKIVFVDADDDIPINALESFIEYDEDLVISNMIIIYEEPIKLNIDNQIFQSSEYHELIEKYHNTTILRAVYGKLYYRDILINNNIRFDENIHWGEDRLFVLHVLKHCRNVRLIPNVTYSYYFPTQGRIYKFSLEEYYHDIAAIENALNDIGDCPIALEDTRTSYLSVLINILSSSPKPKLELIKDIVKKRIWNFTPRKRKYRSLIELIRVIVLR